MYVLSGLFLLLLPWLVIAGSVTTQQRAVPFTAIVAVDQTATTIVLDFNGDGVADPAGLVTLYNKAGDGIYCVDRGTATVIGAPLEVGQSFTFNRRGSTAKLTQFSCVTAAGLAATLHIWADP